MVSARNIFLVDVEASGLGPHTFPIEIALINLAGDASYSALIRPHQDWADWHWDEISEQVHNISWEQLQEEGLPAERVAREAWAILASANLKLYSDAPEADAAWLEALRDLCWPPLPGLTIRHVRELLKSAAALDFLDDTRRHRAGADVSELRQAILSRI